MPKPALTQREKWEREHRQRGRQFMFKWTVIFLLAGLLPTLFVLYTSRG